MSDLLKMQKSTLCYLMKDGKWLMLYRNRKKNDINEGKWIGVGGKVEKGETPRQGILREIYEETNLNVDTLQYRGILYFVYEKKDAEKIYVYTSDQFHGDLKECDEGTLEWIPETEILNLDLWDGDRIFLQKLLNHDDSIFCYQLRYNEDGELIKAVEEGAESEYE